MRFVLAFVQFTSNAAAVKRELRMYFQPLKKRRRRGGTDKDRVKVGNERDGLRGVLHHVLVPNKFQHCSLTEEQVDLVFCVGIGGREVSSPQ